MESKEHLKLYHEKLKTHPKEKASFLSNFFFCWEISLFAKGRQKGFAEGNLYKPLKEYASKQLGDKLEHLWLEEEIFLKKPCLKRALTKLFGLEFLVYGIIYFPVQIITTLLLPTCIKKLMDYYTPHQQNITQKQAWIYASGLILLSLVRVVFYRWFLMQLSVFGMKKNDLEKITTGQIVNLLSNDVNKFDRAFMFLHFLWIGPIELMAVTWYMVVTFGYTAIIGITMIILSVFLQICVVKKIPILRRKMALETDQRIRLMNDIIHGIQTIKMYTWENSFIKLVETARSLEIKQIRSAMQCRLINNTFKMYVTKCCIFLVILVTTLCGTPLTPQYLFALITLYEGIKATVTVSFPSALILFPESLISIQRIQDFLLHNQIMSEPLDKTTNNFARTADKCIMKSYHISEKKFTGVTITDLSFKWDKSLTKYIFNSENFNVCTGEIVGVVGSAGSGKSTLLQIILREVDCIKGSIEVGGSISYASQDPWIFSASVRQNILFGEELDLEKYNKIVKVCGLEHDVDVLPYGDQTLVGERGIMLSGGQKARINLARAVYRDADIYLLDDPLSAVDVQEPQENRRNYEKFCFCTCFGFYSRLTHNKSL
ncbi:hypothetical protein MTP99_006822 [Tenebrio molitor]|nr:hypothetical protein MTP99_006822 [Tenebrio molitor]